MSNKIRPLCSYTPGKRPAVDKGAKGNLYLNITDRQLGIFDADGQPVDLLALRLFSDKAVYNAGDLIVHQGQIYKALVPITTPGQLNGARWEKITGSGTGGSGSGGTGLVTIRQVTLNNSSGDLAADINNEPQGLIVPDGEVVIISDLGHTTTAIWKGGSGQFGKAAGFMEVFDDMFVILADRNSTGGPGPKGDPGPQGLPGQDGTSSIIQGTDTQANIEGTAGSLGDVWIVSTGTLEGHGLISDGLGAGVAHWTDIGQLKGEKGDPGPKGVDGTNGVDGAKGDPGPAGRDGINGKQGPQGIAGVSLNVLPPVATEADRIAASAGWTADDAGKALLQIDTGEFWYWSGSAWVDAGHLTGPEGPAGKNGVDGAKGDPGKDGKNGKDGISIQIQTPVADHAALTALSTGWGAADEGKAVLQSDVGDLFVWTGNAWLNAGHVQGPKGDPGQKGAKGDPGQDGTGVSIKGSATEAVIKAKTGAAAGDMWLVSTGAKEGHGLVSDGSGGWTDVGQIKGPKGDTGPKGPKGDTGAAGTPGARGPKGANGTNGVDGAKGDTGPRGPAGPQGKTGTRGAQGVQGPSGISINVLAPVADEAARLALSTGWSKADAGKSMLQIDTGEFWTWSGAAWIDAGHLVGPQGPRGLKGADGVDGKPGVTKFATVAEVNTGTVADAAITPASAKSTLLHLAKVAGMQTVNAPVGFRGAVTFGGTIPIAVTFRGGTVEGLPNAPALMKNFFIKQSENHLRERIMTPAGARPAVDAGHINEMYVNPSDRQIGIQDNKGNPIDYLAVRMFTPTAVYKQGDIVVRNGQFYRAVHAIAAPKAYDAKDWEAVAAQTKFATPQDVSAGTVADAAITPASAKSTLLHLNSAAGYQRVDTPVTFVKPVTVGSGTTPSILFFNGGELKGVNGKLVTITNSVIDALVNKIRFRVSTPAGRRPVVNVQHKLEAYVNFADLQFGIQNNTGTPIDLLAIRKFSPAAKYVQGDIVVRAAALYKAKHDITPGALKAADWTPLVPTPPKVFNWEISTQGTVTAVADTGYIMKTNTGTVTLPKGVRRDMVAVRYGSVMTGNLKLKPAAGDKIEGQTETLDIDAFGVKLVFTSNTNGGWRVIEHMSCLGVKK